MREFKNANGEVMTEAQIEQIVSSFGTLAGLNNEAKDLHDEWESLKRRANAAKGAWEEKMAEIQTVIEEASEDEPPLFKKIGKDSNLSGDADGDEAWRAVALSSLSDPAIPKKTIKALAAVRNTQFPDGIRTIGDVSEFQKDGAPLTMIKGVTENGHENIAAAIDAYWGRSEQGADTDEVEEEID